MVVLVVGEALIDVVEHADGNVETHPGGSPFNVAIGLARLGVEVVLATQVGPDDAGMMLKRVAAMEGVELAPLRELERTSTATATVAADGSATYAFDLAWNPGPLPDPSGFEAVHVGSLGTFVDPGCAAVADLVLSADAMGVPVSFDPNVRTSVSPDPKLWRYAASAVAPHAAVVKVSDEDAEVLGDDFGAPDSALVLTTLGAGGAVAIHGGRRVEVTAEPVEVVDTIGAGDSFVAATLAWLATYQWPRAHELVEDELRELLTQSVRAAAVTCSRPGADPPRLDEL